MNRHERITSGEKKKRPAGAIAGKKPAASAETKRSVNAAQAKPSLNVADAINDIAQRSGNLLKKQTQKLNDDDCYQVIDPRTVAAAMGECARRATFDPAALYKQQLALWNDLAELFQRTAARMVSNKPTVPVIEPDKSDKRFKSELWDEPIFDYLKQYYLLMSRFLDGSVASIGGMDSQTRKKLEFYTRQFVSALSPANFAATNPVAVKATMESGGENLIRGLRNFIEDLERGDGRLNIKMCDLAAFRVGENVACTPGKVIFQNELMQLIQYAPSTPSVYRRPLLIVPPWINKFYILDLNPKKSFIKWCVDQGHTVFVISWVNPGAELTGKGFSDYMLAGPIAALQAIERAIGETEINAIGYCIGGTLTTSTLAYLAAQGKRPITAAALFTTLLDFSDVGDISVFLDEGQLELADKHMQRLGYLEGHHMGEAFNLMRENDLIWFFFVNNYLLGRDPAAFDILYWNSDTTRMPAKMHSFYLRNMYHRNVLKNPGGIELAGVPIDLGKVTTPVYFLSTREDHIAPWRTTYAGTQLVSGPVRFVLGASGHVAGVINPPSANKYGYWTGETASDSETWLARASFHEGSWWDDWAGWIARHAGERVPARQPDTSKLTPIEDAPGSYVKVRIS